MWVLLPLAVAGLLAPAPAHVHKTIAEKKALLDDLQAKEHQLKQEEGQEKALKAKAARLAKAEKKQELTKELEGKEQELAKLEKKEALVKELKTKEVQLAKLEHKKELITELEGKEAQLAKLEKKKELMTELEGKEVELAKLEKIKAMKEELEAKEKKLAETKVEIAKIDKKEELVKELESKEQELATLKAKEAELKAAQGKKEETPVVAAAPVEAKAAAPAAVPVAAPAANATKAPKKEISASDAADRLLQALGQIKNLKGVFKEDAGFGGAMGNELANGDGIWGAVEELEKAAKTKSNGTSLESAMNSFTNKMGKTLHAIDEKDEVSSEEYVLGLLAHHRNNASAQRRILGNFTSLHSVEELLAEKPAPADLASEYANLLDKEHPAAKPLTAFLQRVM